MKNISELNIPDGLLFTKDHEWAKRDGDKVRIGVSDYAQDQLGDIVFVELPEVGAVLAKGDEFGSLESVKAVSELYIPLSGEVLAVNPALEDSPELVNSSPYDEAWMIEIKLSDPAELGQLMDKVAYLEALKATE